MMLNSNDNINESNGSLPEHDTSSITQSHTNMDEDESHKVIKKTFFLNM